MDAFGPDVGVVCALSVSTFFEVVDRSSGVDSLDSLATKFSISVMTTSS